jgi:DNA polymerase-3 subunit epsilon
MSWFKRFFHKQPVDANRWVVLDVETTGLDTRKAVLLEIAAVTLHLDPETQKLKIDVTDSFEAVLKQDIGFNKENILLHGIGVGAQKTGEDPKRVLQEFEKWVGNSPLLGFHVVFDETMIQKTFREHLQRELPNIWIDIEPLVARTYPLVKARYMDDWMKHMGIECAVRHQAAADTFATAEILMQIWPKLRVSANKIEEIHQLALRVAKLPRD